MTIVREHLSQARSELAFAKQHPGYCCDVCGPDGQHTFHACHMAVLGAVKGLLIFHKQEPEKTYDVIRLADSAVSHVKGFQECMPLIQALTRCGTLEWEVPENSETLRRERAEALLLAEQIVEFIASRLPEHD